jgi:hypothetical protein
MRERRNMYVDCVAITRHLVEVRGWAGTRQRQLGGGRTVLRTRLAAAQAMTRTNPDDLEIAREYPRAQQKLADLPATP